MRKSKTLWAGLAIVGVLSGVAVAAVTESFKTKGKGLQATFTIGDNCQAASTTVTYAEAIIKTNGVKEVQEPLVFLDIDYVNVCPPRNSPPDTPPDHLILTGSSNVVQAQISGNLDHAHLTANVPVADAANNKKATIHLNLDFTGSGPLNTVADKSKSREGNVVMKSNFTFKSRDAQATGTIAGTLPLTGRKMFTNLTQGPSTFANIGTSRTGDITITRKH